MLTARKTRAKLPVSRYFSEAPPQLDWEERDITIEDWETGKVIFSQKGFRTPTSWSVNAAKIFASKYAFGPANSREKGVDTVVYRVVNAIREAGVRHDYFSEKASFIFANELEFLLLNQYAAFNSPVWFNVGIFESRNLLGDGTTWYAKEDGRIVKTTHSYKYPQISACFIQSVEDTMESIMELATTEAMLFRFGSGSGTNLSPIRSKKEFLSTGGRPSGPVSFLKIYDRIAATIKSGGKCLAYEQPVYTATGARTAEELAASGEKFVTLSYSNRLGRVAAKEAQAWFSGVKPGVEVVTDKGTFRTSYDHPFMLRTGQCVRACDLTPGLSLMAGKTYKHNHGYVEVKLFAHVAGKELLHRLVARDVCGLDIDGKSVHHRDSDKTNYSPENLEVMTQGEHAGLHGAGNYFYCASFPGEKNGMHRDSAFWADAEKVAAYQEKQSTILKESGRAATMQESAVRQKMLNTGYELINAGYDISTFKAYIKARHQHGRKIANYAKQTAAFDRVFGSYQDFLVALSAGNHRVISVRDIGDIGVVSIEVFDDEPDDKRPWSEHNYAICPVETTGTHASYIHVLNTRRAAKMNILNCDHPDVMDFITCKSREEAKAKALIAMGYEASFNGEAYDTVAFQNANLSVRFTDDFMRAYETGMSWPLKAVTTGEVVETIDPRAIFRAVAEETWKCGDPGVQFDTLINDWHTCPNSGVQTSSNPCSEYLFLDETACNLASFRLTKFLKDGSFDAESFKQAVRTFTIAMDILVSMAGYPSEKIAKGAWKYRTLGLGFADLGALLMSLGLPYDSDAGRSMAASITSLLTATAYLTSAELANYMGAFPEYEKNADPMLGVIDKHLDAAYSLKDSTSYVTWIDAKTLGMAWGYRNAQVSCVAPTGTIALTMDCDTTGAEPSIGLRSFKSLAGGGHMEMVNRVAKTGLKTLGYEGDRLESALEGIARDGFVSDIEPEHVSVFDCALAPTGCDRVISPWGHLKMVAAIQPFVSGGISKTVNVPNDFSVEQIEETYYEAWKMGVKCVTVYRDGSKGSQPLSLDKPKKAKCISCGSDILIAAGTCTICPSCGTSQGGCS